VTLAVEASGWGWRHAGRNAWAVRGLDLRIEAGEKVLLLGSSGAGKSTLLTALAGLLEAPDAGDEEGRLLVGGIAPAAARTGTALVTQDPSSAIVMGRIGDEVAFGLENRAVPPGEIWPRVEAALAAVGLGYPLSHRTERLSGGEQQRLAVAGVLALEPRLWLLDEPTANLDPDGAAMVRETISSVAGGIGATVVLVEHRVSALADLVDRVVVLEPGAGVLTDGCPADVFGRHAASLRAAGVWVPGPAPARLGPVRPAGPGVVEACAVVVRHPGAERAAVNGVDLVAHAGQVLAVTGANGSGKTSLALALASLEVPAGGEVRYLAAGDGWAAVPNRPYSRWRPRDLVRHVGTVFQEPEHQFLAGTVAAELAIGPRRAGLPAAEAERRAAELLAVRRRETPPLRRHRPRHRPAVARPRRADVRPGRPHLGRARRPPR
jgi:energy-coupling factor transporter ATP-binding protein EcfA2